MRYDEIEAALRSAGLPVVRCGLNADWSVQAWCFGPGEANRRSGQLFLLDEEDGDDFAVVRRHWDADMENDRVEYLRGEDAMTLAQAIEVLKVEAQPLLAPMWTLADHWTARGFGLAPPEWSFKVPIASAVGRDAARCIDMMAPLYAHWDAAVRDELIPALVRQLEVLYFG